MKPNTLILAGCGIKFMSHLTIETKNCIEKANKVLYLVNEPATQEWIQSVNPNSESLDSLYTQKENRSDNYALITNYIIDTLQHHQALCVVMYGHPTVFVQPTLDAADLAKKQGYSVVVLPGISTEDCLFADLIIDPGTYGCQSYEATDFLIYQRNYDPQSHLILWQPYVIGLLTQPNNHNPKSGLLLLVEYLAEKYSLMHEVIIYEASQYPALKPRIEKIQLKNLPVANISRLSTLYVPPKEPKQPDSVMIEKLKKLIS